jgi:hypothetical protein
VQKVELEMAAWHRIYKELQQARLLLEEERASTTSGAAVAELEARVKKLQQQSDQALDGVAAAIASFKSRQVQGNVR